MRMSTTHTRARALAGPHAHAYHKPTNSDIPSSLKVTTAGMGDAILAALVDG